MNIFIPSEPHCALLKLAYPKWPHGCLRNGGGGQMSDQRHIEAYTCDLGSVQICSNMMVMIMTDGE